MDKQSIWKKVILSATIISVLAIISIIVLDKFNEKTEKEITAFSEWESPLSLGMG